MSVNLGGFNVNNAPSRNSPVPAGSYAAVIVDAAEKQAKTGAKGKYLELKLQIVDGPHKGRVVFDRLNLWHKDATTKTLALATLGEIGRAVGIAIINSTDDLKNKPMVIVIIVRERSDIKGEFSNEVKKYESIKKAAKALPGVAATKKTRKPKPEPVAPVVEESTEEEVEDEDVESVVEVEMEDDEDDEDDEEYEEEGDVLPPWS
jgi:hypothetical protein